MKYKPDFPLRFGAIQDARGWARGFFPWYNDEHHHSGIAMMTPATVHYGLADQVTAQRQHVLDAAYAQHPERFVKGAPIPPQLPKSVWINPPPAASAPDPNHDTLPTTCAEDRATLESDLSADAGYGVTGRG